MRKKSIQGEKETGEVLLFNVKQGVLNVMLDC